MTKSYEDGIMDALNIIYRWNHIPLIHSVINTIQDQLIKLLPPGYIINSADIVYVDKPGEEIGYKKDYDQC